LRKESWYEEKQLYNIQFDIEFHIGFDWNEKGEKRSIYFVDFSVSCKALLVTHQTTEALATTTLYISSRVFILIYNSGDIKKAFGRGI